MLSTFKIRGSWSPVYPTHTLSLWCSPTTECSSVCFPPHCCIDVYRVQQALNHCMFKSFTRTFINSIFTLLTEIILNYWSRTSCGSSMLPDDCHISLVTMGCVANASSKTCTYTIYKKRQMFKIKEWWKYYKYCNWMTLQYGKKERFWRMKMKWYHQQ